MADFRVLLYDQKGNPEGELSKDAGTLLSCTRSEEINGEHSLTLTTQRHLEVGTRALTHHSDGRWREWVVDEPEETHDTGEHAIGTYHLCWSLQYDLQTVYGSIRELGMLAPATARQAMEAALDGTRMWEVGTVDVATRASSVVMNNDSSAWDRLTTVVKYWGGEIDAEITTDEMGVTSREVCLLRHLGSKTADRRFEWGHDLTGITRTPDPGPYVCRMIPLGNGEQEEAADGETTYDVRLDIYEALSFYDTEMDIYHDFATTYIGDRQTEYLFRKADGHGGWEYPTTVVTFSTDDADELAEFGKQDVLYHTRPGISYSGSVASFRKAGMDTDSIGLGDEVQVVDMGFNPDRGLRVQERILHMEIDEMGIEDAQIDVGKLVPKLERTLATVTKTVGTKLVSYNMPKTDATPFVESTPELGVYLVDPVDSAMEQEDMEGVVVQPYSYETTDYGSTIADLQGQVSDIYDGSAGIVGVDGIIHQFNGVTMTDGTINFTAVASDDSSGGDGGPSISDAVEKYASDLGKAVGKSLKESVASMWGSRPNGGS